MEKKPYENSLEKFSMDIVTIGSQGKISKGVGKTAIIRCFEDEQFNVNFTYTIGVDFTTKKIEREGKIIKIKVWDTVN